MKRERVLPLGLDLPLAYLVKLSYTCLAVAGVADSRRDTRSGSGKKRPKQSSSPTKESIQIHASRHRKFCAYSVSPPCGVCRLHLYVTKSEGHYATSGI